MTLCACILYFSLKDILYNACVTTEYSFLQSVGHVIISQVKDEIPFSGSNQITKYFCSIPAQLTCKKTKNKTVHVCDISRVLDPGPVLS